MAIEEDVLRRMRYLQGLVVTIYEHLLWRLVSWSYIGGKLFPINDNSDDLVRFIPKCVGEFAEILGVMDWQTPEEQCSMTGK